MKLRSSTEIIANATIAWKQQRCKEVTEAIVFLRKHNHTVPDETIELMKKAALKAIEDLSRAV